MLPDERRTQLDGILSQMEQNGESRNAIDFVVNDFKNKYSVEPPKKSFTERTAGVLDAIFGGGKLGEAIGTQIAKARVPKEQRDLVAPGPKPLEVAGSVLQSASLFAPVGAGAKALTTGVRALGLKTGASALGKIGAGALAGEVFDIASNLQQGKTGKDAITPGLGALIGGAIPGAGVAKNISVRFGERQAPRIVNSLIKPLAKDFSYGKNPGRAVAEEGIIANNFDELITGIRTSRQKIGQEIGKLGDTLSERPLLNIQSALNPLDDAIKTAVSQNNSTLLSRLNNVKRALTEVLEPTLDDTGNIAIKSLGSKNLDSLTFKQAREILGEVGELTSFTGNPSDDKLVNSALKQIYGKIKGQTIASAKEINSEIATQFQKLTEKYADLMSAEVATKYRDKIVERSALIGLSPQSAGIGAGLITAVATGGATIPAVLVGLSAGAIDKLAQTPAFKTRLAYILSKKTQGEVNFLLRKIPALKSFFSTKNGITPGDILLNKSKSIPNKQGGFSKTGLIASATGATALGATQIDGTKKAPVKQPTVQAETPKTPEDKATVNAEKKYGIKFPKGFLKAVREQESSNKDNPKNLRLSMGLTDSAMKELGKDALPNTSMENVMQNSANYLALKSKLKKADGKVIDLTTPENQIKWYVQRYVGLLPGESRMINGEKVSYDKIYKSFEKLLAKYQ